MVTNGAVGKAAARKRYIKAAVWYKEEEQGLPGQHAHEQELRSPHKKSKSEGVAVASGRGLGRVIAQSAFKPGDPDPTTSVAGRGRASGSLGRRRHSPSKTFQASDRMGWMARLEPWVRFLTPEEWLKEHKVPDSARTL